MRALTNTLQVLTHTWEVSKNLPGVDLRLLPQSVKIPDQPEQAGEQQYPVQNSPDDRAAIGIRQAEIKSGSYCRQQPDQTHGNGIDDTDKKLLHIGIPTAFHDLEFWLKGRRRAEASITAISSALFSGEPVMP